MNPFDPPDSSAPPIRPSVAADTKWIIDFLRERWGASTIVVHGEVIDAARLQALIAEPLRGLATYRRIGGDAELVTLDATPPGRGTGTALIETLTKRLRGEGCARLWLTMTNGNLSGLQFYLRRGFRLIAVRPGAVDRARELKPSIPLLGEHGIPIHDELDLCCVLDPDMRGLPAPAPWGAVPRSAYRGKATPCGRAALHGPIRSAAVVEAFATVPCEHFLGRGPLLAAENGCLLVPLTNAEMRAASC